MSHVVPEELRSMFVCPLVRSENDGPTIIGQNAFKQEAIKGLQQMAADEYGDALPSSAHYYYEEIMNAQPDLAHISIEKAHSIASGAIDCARNRFLGLCATNECTNRDEMTRTLKNTEQEQA